MGKLSDELGKGKEALDDLIKEINQIGTISQEAFGSAAQAIGGMATQLKEAGTANDDVLQSFEQQKNLVKSLENDAKKIAGFSSKDLKSKKDIKKILNQQKTLQSKITRLQSEQSLNEIRLAQAKAKGNTESQIALEYQSEFLSRSLDTANYLNKEFEDIAETNDEINKNTKWADTLAESLGSIPGVGPMISGPFKAASEATREARAKSEGFFKSMGKGLMELVSTKAIIAGIVAIVFEADKKTTDLAKSLQISKKETLKIKEGYADISLNSGKAYLNVHNLMEAQTQLTDETGMAVQFSDDQVKNQTFLTKQLGLSSKTAAKFAKYQTTTGKSAKETNEEIADSVANLQKETGIAFKLNDVFEDVANANAGLKAAYGFNNKLLAQQVIQTKKIGINLEQAESIASSMLDFESSIQAELEAELLTGKSLNLEEARRLALMGKSSEAASEILNQVGSTEDLMKMNVIQQQALAKAAGMERNELIASVKQREVQEKLGGKSLAQLKEEGKTREEIAAITGEELLKQMEQESAAAKFEAAIVRIKEMLAATLEGPLGTFLDFLGAAVGNATVLKSIIVGIGGISLAKTISQFASMAALQATTAVSAMTAASAISFGIGLIAIIAAVATALSSMNSAQDKAASNAKKAGDIMSPSKGVTQVSTKEGGLFELSKNDDLIAAPGAAKAMGNKSNPQVQMQDNTQLIAKIDQLISINKQIAAKSPVLELAGDKVGNGVEQESREIQ